MADEQKYIDEGNRIKEAITRDGRYTQEELAALIPCSYVTLSRYVNGHRLMPDDTYRRVADILDVRIEYLRNEDDFMHDEDIDKFIEHKYKKSFDGHIKLLESIGCAVTPMLYLKISSLAALKEYWPAIKPTLTSESLCSRYRDAAIMLGDWDGNALDDLGFERHASPYRDTYWDGYEYADDYFFSDGLRVRRTIDDLPIRLPLLQPNENIPLRYNLYYVLRYRIDYIKTNALGGVVESSKHFYDVDQLGRMFDDMDDHIRAVMHSHAHSHYYPDYDDNCAAMDRDEFYWDESEQDT